MTFLEIAFEYIRICQKHAPLLMCSDDNVWPVAHYNAFSKDMEELRTKVTPFPEFVISVCLRYKNCTEFDIDKIVVDIMYYQLGGEDGWIKINGN